METIKILIVTDRNSGGYTRPSGAPPSSGDFHLGEFVKILEDTNWQGFDIQITKAHRGSSASADLQNFNFATHDLSQYDEMLLFPIGRDSGSSIAGANEIQAISDFMDAGGGVFATGDHEDLGAGLCRELPRIRSMRRWYFSAGGPDGLPAAPSGTNANRHDTTRSGYDSNYQFSDQSDNTAQEITPTLFSGGGFSNRFFTRKYPHPLLCSPDGIVRHLPDHAHEGQCEVPNNLNLSVLGKDEYPKLPGSNTRLAPVVVANARVIGGHNVVDNNGNQVKPVVNAKNFGVIGAYDGHRIVRDGQRLGRVVVDATWHHFFNINLKGAQAGGTDGSGGDPVKERGFYAPLNPGQADHYRMIKHYFRNIVYWLIPAKRNIIVWSGMLERFSKSGFFYEEMRFDFRRFNQIPIRIYIRIAHLAEAYFKSVRGGCSVLSLNRDIIREFDPIREIFDPIIDPWNPLKKIRDLQQLETNLSSPSLLNAPGPEDINRVLLGATVASFLLAENEILDKKPGENSANVRAKIFKTLLPNVIEHAFSEFGKELKGQQKEQIEYLDKLQKAINLSDSSYSKKEKKPKSKEPEKCKAI